MPTKLAFGQTPWDGLSREELLAEVKRMYAAIASMNSALHLLRHGDTDGFWAKPNGNDRGGSGGRAVEMAAMILGSLDEKHDSENVYRSYFRYAVDLLFSPAIGFRWCACDNCDNLYAPCGEKDLAGTECMNCKHKGRTSLLRPLKWDDLRSRK